MTLLAEELLPLDFVAIGADCHYVEPGDQLTKQHKLPDTAPMQGKKSFATVYFGWNETGVAARFEITGTFQKAHYPNFKEGDCIELFLDTRDVKTAGSLSRFCHHFFFLPKPIKEVDRQEITSFRSGDAHPHCNPDDLFLNVTAGGKKVTMDIGIPATCLHGYAPFDINRLGFTYTIRRQWRSALDFSVSSSQFAVEHNPSLWASLTLRND